MEMVLAVRLSRRDLCLQLLATMISQETIKSKSRFQEACSEYSLQCVM